MSGKNRSKRKELARMYGKGCFFNRAHIAERIEKMGGIKTFKTFVTEKKFKGKKISHKISFHHLKHKTEGGETSLENGANVEEIAHQYLHSLPRDQEEIINDMLRDFKINCIAMSGNGEIQNSCSIETNFDEDFLEIELYEDTEECNINLARKKQNEKYKKYKNPTRAMRKEELKRIIDEEWEI